MHRLWSLCSALSRSNKGEGMIVYFNGDESLNEVALTFDDGPNPPRTERVLDILDLFKIKATFFLLGKWVEKFPETVIEIKRRGHLIGNHSYSHSRENDDFEVCEELIQHTISEVPMFIRPPYGEWGHYPSLKKVSGKKIIVFNFQPIDYQCPGVDEIIRYYTSNTKNGSIIVLHDGNHKEASSNRSDQMIQALPEILKELRDKFRFVRLDEMKLIPKEVE
jgi:peptidoglycan/xylan/chitin deacetylase (PgdA/CDA1 family)